jgi:NADH-quinone oxidoreductase subunit G
LAVNVTVETVTLTIDGKAVTVPKGTNILEAARTIGVDISYFCYHPGLSSPAVCRQCLVEVKGAPKPVPSCYTPVADKMEVQTASPRSLEVRQQMLEFTLVNHPVDCPICDKAGECTLQKLYQEHDSSASRVDYDKVHKPKVVDLGPTIVLDAERCILCTRCIRVCDEVAGEHQLEMAWRGDREQLTTAPGEHLDNPYSLNTVDVCPVGALTSKDFRFAMRTWELNSTDSVCNGCSTGCNMEVHHAQGRIYRLVPRHNPDVNKYWMCDEGRLTYKGIREGRLAGARVEGKTISHDKALAAFVGALESARGPGGLGVVLSASASNEDNFAIAKLAKALGAERVWVSAKAPVPERADKILRSDDVNSNSRGATAIAKALFAEVRDMKSLAGDAAGMAALLVLGDEGIDALGTVASKVLMLACHDNLADKARAALPAATWAELHGTYTNRDGRTQRARAAVEPPGEARPAHEWVAMLSKKLNASVEYPTIRALFNDMKSVVPEFSGAEFGRDLPTVQLRFAHSRG